MGRLDLNRIWFGCGNFGGMGSSPSLRHAGDNKETALQLLDHARRVGLRRFDTANTYGGGTIGRGSWRDDADGGSSLRARYARGGLLIIAPRKIEHFASYGLKPR